VLLACVASLWGLLVNAHRHHPVSVVVAMLGMHLAEAWLPPLGPVLQATFRHVSPAPGLLLLVTGQTVALGLACAAAGTSLARARRPG